MSDTDPVSEHMDHARTMELHNEARRLDDLLVWTIYNSPSDFPGKLVARPHSTRRNAPLLAHIEADSLTALRAMLPPGLHRIERDPADDPIIVEVWI